jgi:hypothetical protein
MASSWGNSWGSAWGSSWGSLIARAARVFAKITGGPVTKSSTRGGIIFKGTQR